MTGLVRLETQSIDYNLVYAHLVRCNILVIRWCNLCWWLSLWLLGKTKILIKHYHTVCKMLVKATIPICRSEFPLKKLCSDRTEMLNGIQDPYTNSNNFNNNNQRPIKPVSPLQPPAADPYAFSDEASSTPATLSRSMRNSREDLFQRPSPFKVSHSLCNFRRLNEMN